jgi:hypothetical protein
MLTIARQAILPHQKICSREPVSAPARKHIYTEQGEAMCSFCSHVPLRAVRQLGLGLSFIAWHHWCQTMHAEVCSCIGDVFAFSLVYVIRHLLNVCRHVEDKDGRRVQSVSGALILMQLVHSTTLLKHNHSLSPPE